MGAGERGMNICYLLHSGPLVNLPVLLTVQLIMKSFLKQCETFNKYSLDRNMENHNHLLLISTDVTGPGHDRERDDLAQGTEVEEEEVVVEEAAAEEAAAAVTMRDVAPETESVQDDSEPLATTTRPSIPVSLYHPQYFF